MNMNGSGKGMLSPSTEYTISYSVFIYYFSQAEVHLGDLWHGFIERCPAGSYVQSFDREDQHCRLSPLVEGGRSGQRKSARFCDGWQRQETMAGGRFAGRYLLLLGGRRAESSNWRRNA